MGGELWGVMMGFSSNNSYYKCIYMVSGRFFSPKKLNRQMRCWGGLRHSSRQQWYGVNLSASTLTPDVGVTLMPLLRAPSAHRQWYGPKPPAAMVGGKHDVSGETEGCERM